MLAYFQNFLFTYLVFSNVIGYGYLLTFYLKQKENNFTFLFFNGTILIIFVSILINFFTPLHSNITNILFIIFTIIGSYKVYREIFYSHNFKLIIFVLLFASTIIFKSYPYNDYEFYHLPYIEILRNFKIIFGLSNFEFSYGYPSIFQNITALQYNLFMKLDSFIFYTPLLVSVLLGETFFKYIKLNNLIIKFLSYIFIVNFLIHANRYGSLGNDFPAHAISMFSYILFFSIIFIDKNNKKLYLFILTLIIAIFAKLTLLLNLLLIIPIFLFKRNILKLNTRTLIFILIVTFSILLKNFINTSCLFFPISTTCFQTNWSAEKYDFSSAKMVNAYISALALGYKSLDLGYSENNVHFNSKEIINKEIEKDKNIYNHLSKYQQKVFEKYVVHKEYIKFKNWFKSIPQNVPIKEHFEKKILNDLILFLFINIILYYFYNGNYKFRKSEQYNINKLNKYHIYFFSFIIISCITWFVKGPLLRYGISHLYVLANIPLFIIIIYFSSSHRNISKFFNFLIIIVLIFSLIDNIIRINKFVLKNEYTDSIVPVKIVKYKRINFNGYELSLPVSPRKLGRFCSFSKPLCISQVDFLESDFKISNENNYLFIVKK